MADLNEFCEFRTNIAMLLRRLRDTRKLSREQLARRLGVTAPTIYNMELGKTRVPLSVFFAWLDAVKLNVAKIMAENMFSIQSEAYVSDMIHGAAVEITAKIVLHFRNRLKMTQKDLALALGYASSSMIHHFEKGIREASAEDLFRLIVLAQDNLRGMIYAFCGEETLANLFPTGLAATLNDWEDYWSHHYISAVRQLMRTSLYESLRFYKIGMFAAALDISLEDEKQALDIMTKLGIVQWINDKPTIDPAVKILIPRHVSSDILTQFKSDWFDRTKSRYNAQSLSPGLFSIDLIPANPDHFSRVIKMIRNLQDEIHNMPQTDTSGVMCLGWIGGYTPLPDVRV